MNLTDSILESLIQHSADGIQILDEHGATLRVNEPFLRTFGFGSAADVEGSFNPLTDDAVREQGVVPYLERAYRGETVHTPIVAFRSPLGPSRDIRATISPVLDESGAVRRVVLVIEDFTEVQASTDALGRRFRQMSMLQESFRQLTGEPSADIVLSKVLAAMRGLDPGASCAVWRASPDGVWTCVASEGLSENYCRDVEALYADTYERHALFGTRLSGHRTVVADDTSSERLASGIRELMEREHITRIVAAPMSAGGTVIGSLCLYCHEPGHFDPVDVETVTLLANETATALHLADLYDIAQESAAEALVLNRLAELLTRPSGLSEVLKTITETIAPLMNVSRVAVYRVDDATDEVVLMAYTGAEADEVARCGMDRPRKVSERHPLVHQMIASGEPLVLNELDDDTLAAFDERQRACVRALDIRSLLMVPMFDDGRPVGTMSFDEPGVKHRWSRREIRLAQAFAAQAAVAIRNARLLDEARITRESLEEMVAERTEDLRAAHAEVIATEKVTAVGFMAREVAHGLRNPLNVISTSLYYLKSRYHDPDEKILRHFDTIARSVEQAANTITQMMNLAGSRLPEMAPVDLNLLAQRALQDRFTSGDFHWVAQWEAPPPHVLGDWTQISHAMKSLIGYAASRHDMIHVCTSREGRHAVFSVGDDRPPPTGEERAALFQPFFASATEWTGLGLSVARQIAQKHGGDLSLEEADGLTWVRLRLPLMADGGADVG